MMRLQFLGAACTVTGSRHCLTLDDRKILVDAGLFQGLKEIRSRNWEPLDVEARSLQSVLLTHAHIDHSGFIPRLVRDGYRGHVHCTPATKELCELLLPDSARLQQEEAGYRNRHNFTKHQPALPLYTEEEAYKALERFRTVAYGKPLELGHGVTVTYHDAGHILGSSWLQVDIVRTEQPPLRIVFSGDIGREGVPMLRDPEPPVECDYLVLESTYGDRLHGNHDVAARLGQIVQETIHEKGVLVIPAFAVERTQELIYLLQRLSSERAFGRVPIFLDSPMAAKATRIFSRYRRDLDDEAREQARDLGELTEYRNLRICETTGESKAVNRQTPPFVVISASGMATGGRILHHLRHYLPDPRNRVLLVGYQSVGTRGWRLQNGEPTLRLFNDEVPVRARVETLDGWSGHADYEQINRWLKTLQRPPKRIFLVHGEGPALEAQRARICEWPGWSAHVPTHLETVTLD